MLQCSMVVCDCVCGNVPVHLLVNYNMCPMYHLLFITEIIYLKPRSFFLQLKCFKKDRKISNDKVEEESEEIRKIKKVSSNILHGIFSALP